jgi:hypothetical protein
MRASAPFGRDLLKSSQGESDRRPAPTNRVGGEPVPSAMVDSRPLDSLVVVVGVNGCGIARDAVRAWPIGQCWSKRLTLRADAALLLAGGLGIRKLSMAAPAISLIVGRLGEADLSSLIAAVAGALKDDTAGQASRPAIPERDKNPRADCSGVEALAALAERGGRGQRPLQIRFDGAGFVERRGSAYLAIENPLAKQNLVI